jgi:glutathione synthase/RimK-type ligase-like ATP-grasp enzyme
MELRIATVRPLPEPDPDEEPLLAALAERGVDARMAAWRDPAEDWDAPVATVVRSTWDYLHHLEAFLAWTERASRAAPLWNPPAVLRWNVHKFYLRELEERGFPIVPTEFVARGARVRLAEILAARGWGEVVVKPAVSAASFGTVRVRAAVPDELARGEAHLAELLATRDVLVQRYAPAVESSGERALVWIDGALTHAVRKSPRFLGQEESVGGAVPIAEDERVLALSLLAPFRAELLYGRVDLVRDEEGRPTVMELELLEPSLFLVQSSEALGRLADGLARRLA